MPVEALEACQPETVVLDVRDHALACKQRNAAICVGKHSTDEATDAAGSCHGDRPGRIHVASIPRPSVSAHAKFDSREPVRCLSILGRSLGHSPWTAPCNHDTATLCFPPGGQATGR